MPTKMLSLDERRAKLQTKFKVGLAILAAAIVAPVVWLAVGGLIGLAVAGVLALTIVNAAPVLSMKLANWRLKAIKAEAYKNPVETLQMALKEKLEKLEQFRLKIVEFSTSVKSYRSKVQAFSEKWPDKASVFQEQLRNMEALLEKRKNAYQVAVKESQSFELKIQEADAMWQMAMAAQDMNEAANLTGDDLMEKIKVDTSLNSVQDAMNRAFTDLEMMILDEDVPALPNEKAMTLDDPRLITEQPVKVKVK